jgi:hypothetical protein
VENKIVINNAKRRKLIIISMVSIIIFGFAVSVLPWQSNINITLHGIQTRIGDTEYAEEISITIRGRYWRYLFRRDKFEGNIEVEGYAVTLGSLLTPLILPESSLSYWCRFGRFEIESFGRIYAVPGFSKVLISVFEAYPNGGKIWSSEDGLIIGAPADNIEQVIEIWNELTRWTDYSEWE